MEANKNLTVSVVDSRDGARPRLNIVVGGGDAKVITWPGNGALYRTFHLIDLRPGARTIPQRHKSESVYYVIAGQGLVRDVISGEEHQLSEGAMVHIAVEDSYQFEAVVGNSDFKLVGGPCPADESLYKDYMRNAGENI